MSGLPARPGSDRLKSHRRSLSVSLLALVLTGLAAGAGGATRIQGGQIIIGPSVPGVSTNRRDYAVGSTPGTLSVEQGAATYSIPLPLPPGVAGMEPSLAIQYSSQAGNGPLGMGFSLTGLSQIARCARTPAQDGARGDLNYDAGDRFCLDGQRLLAIRGADGGDGTGYRTEIDGFSRIISYGRAGNGPAWFRVWTKGGQIIDYGTEDAALLPAGRTDASIAVWSVKTIRDTVGNQISVTYFRDAARREAYPTRVTWPGGRVDLIYENRPDPISGYDRGGLYRLSKRLVRIDAWSGSLKQGEFRLAYQADGVAPVSRLTTVTQCDGAGVCLPPTVFTWEGGDIALPGSKGNGLAGLCRSGSTDHGVCNDEDNFNSLQYPDIDGDGVTDVCYRGDRGIQCFLGDGAGGWRQRIDTLICTNGSKSYGICNDDDNYATIRFIDLNGDGRADLFYRGDSGIQVRLSTGTGFKFHFSSSICANGSNEHGVCNDADNHYSLQFADVNGDGDADLCYRGDTGIQCVLNDGQGRFGTRIATDICANGSMGYGVCNDADNWDTIRLLDLNGDGRSDLLYRGDQGIQVHFSHDSGFRPVGVSAICANGWIDRGVCNDADNHRYIFNPDLNGDRLPDLCYRGDAGIHCFLSNGSGGWVQERATNVCANGSTRNGVCNDADNYDTLQFVDYDGDGKSDLVVRSDNGLRFFLNTGSTFFELASPLCRNGDCFRRQSLAYADVNADGLADLLMQESDGLKTWSQPNYQPRQVSRITDGLGGWTALTYRPLTDPTVYDDTATLSARELALRGPAWVVAAAETSDGQGGSNRVRYRYGGAKAHRDGRGLLGFAWEQATDEATGRVSSIEYRQDFPFTGTAWRTSDYLADGALVARTTLTLAARATVGGAQATWASRTVQQNWEPDGQLVATVDSRESNHDDYGNPGTLDVRTSADGQTFRKIATSTYRNIVDANRWYLGRLTRAVVTHIDAANARSVKTSAFAYDETTGLLREEIIEPDNNAPGIRQTTSYEYDRFGNQTRVTVAGTDSRGQPLSRATTTTWTADGRFVATIANALGHTERHVYDPRSGVLTQLTGPNGQVTRWTLDGFGRQVAERRADGTATLSERTWVDAADGAAPPAAVYRLSEQQTANNDADRLPPAVQYLDEAGRVLRKVHTGFDGTLVFEDSEFDHRGREVAVSLPYYAGDPVYWVETVYDALDRVIEKASQTSRHLVVNRLAYAGTSTTETNTLGQRKSTWVNAEGNPVLVEEEEGAGVRYAYDPRGNLTRTEQYAASAAVISTIAYDLRDRKIAMDDADMGRWTYGYNSFGELEWQQDAVGNRIEMTYDALGRMVRRDDITAAGTRETTQWTFDRAVRGKGYWLGKVASISGPTPGLEISLRYDALGRDAGATQRVDDKTFVLGNEYDAFGRISATVQPEGFRIEQRYNAFGWLVEQRTPVTTPVDGHDPAFVRGLLDRTLASAEQALADASALAGQAAWFEAKAGEYEGVLAALIADQQLVPGAPNLGTAALALLRDGAGLLHVRTPPAGSQPERLYRLTNDSGGWRLGLLTAANAAALTPRLAQTGDSLYFGDFNADGRRDFIRVPNGSRDRSSAQCGQGADTGALAAGTPNLAADGPLPLHRDQDGNEYVLAPARLLILHGAVATPLTTRPEQAYRLSFAPGDGRWRLEPVAAETWRTCVAPRLLSDTRRVAFGDFDGNGQPDFRRLDGTGTPLPFSAVGATACAPLPDPGPLVDRALFDGLLAVAGSVRDAATLLQRQAGSALSLARDLVLIAADLRDRERQATLWAAGGDVDDLRALTAENGWLVLWRATARDAAGRLSAERAGNGLVTIRDYDPANGQLASIQTGHGYGGRLRHLTYEYDALDNVLARRDETADITESFEYDRLNRLTASHLSGTLRGVAYAGSTEYHYDGLGNLTFKTGIGAYRYGNGDARPTDAGPHAVLAAGNRGALVYDDNGNLLTGSGRSVQWSAANLPTRLAKGSAAVSFAYGADRDRYKKTVQTGASVSETTWYIGKGYERTEKAGAVTHKYFVTGDDGVAAIYVRTGRNGLIDPARDQVRYLHRDALGSVDTITDGRGIAIERGGFSPFGERRAGEWQGAVTGVALFTNRGFTGHEHLDEIGLIHMNGRVYDPELGRFLSADPFVQFPDSSQSYNRYSYVLNNPMRYVDPSGYGILSKILKGIKNAFKKVVNWVKENARAIFAAALGVLTGGAAFALLGPVIGSFAATVAAGAIGNAVGAFVMTGSLDAALRGAVVGALGGALTWGIANLPIPGTAPAAVAFVARRVLHGAAQGLISRVQGGDFRTSFLGSLLQDAHGLVKGWIGNAQNWASSVARVVADTISGGLEARLGGGKFASGARSRALQAVFGEGYRLIAKSAPDAGPGGPAVEKDASGGTVADANNWGLHCTANCEAMRNQGVRGLVVEGGRVSEFANLIPGMNATAAVHDNIQTWFGASGTPLRSVMNPLTMAPAAILAYGALYGNFRTTPEAYRTSYRQPYDYSRIPAIFRF